MFLEEVHDGRVELIGIRRADANPLNPEMLQSLHHGLGSVGTLRARGLSQRGDLTAARLLAGEKAAGRAGPGDAVRSKRFQILSKLNEIVHFAERLHLLSADVAVRSNARDVHRDARRRETIEFIVHQSRSRVEEPDTCPPSLHARPLLSLVFPGRSAMCQKIRVSFRPARNSPAGLPPASLSVPSCRSREPALFAAQSGEVAPRISYGKKSEQEKHLICT